MDIETTLENNKDRKSDSYDPSDDGDNKEHFEEDKILSENDNVNNTKVESYSEAESNESKTEN